MKFVDDDDDESATTETPRNYLHNFDSIDVRSVRAYCVTFSQFLIPGSGVTRMGDTRGGK